MCIWDLEHDTSIYEFIINLKSHLGAKNSENTLHVKIVEKTICLTFSGNSFTHRDSGKYNFVYQAKQIAVVGKHVLSDKSSQTYFTLTKVYFNWQFSTINTQLWEVQSAWNFWKGEAGWN